MVLVNTCGFIQAAKQESIDELLSAVEVRCEGRRGGLPGRALRCGAGRRTARGADPQLRRLRRHRRPPGIHAGLLLPPRAHRPRPPHPAAHYPPPPASRPASATYRTTSSAPTHRHAPHRDLASQTPAPIRARSPRGWGRRPRRAGCSGGGCPPGSWRRWNRVRLRPALLVLRHPVLPRRVRVPAADPRSWPRPAGWPARGIRELVLVSGELHLLRQRPREPAAARGGAAGPGRDRRHRPGQDRLPAARRGAARVVEVIAATPGVAPSLTCLPPPAGGCCGMRRFATASGSSALLDRIAR